MDNKELEIKHLIALRNNYFSVVMLMSSGIAGLFFANFLSVKILGLMLIGLYFDYIFISKFINVNNQIKALIGRNF